MKLLLDTHILPWATCEPENLPHAARVAVEEPGNLASFPPRARGRSRPNMRSVS